jgi:hypothetical protein
MVAETRLQRLPEHVMRAANPPAEPNDVPEAPHERAPRAPVERRESERAVTDFEQEKLRLGQALVLMTLDASAMTSEKWAHRFILTLRPAIEDCGLLFYGAKFAALMELPEAPDQSVPMVEQLPARYVPVFTKGCIASTLSGAPVRLQGAVDREDGRQELYRAAFIALMGEPLRQQRLAFGAFNCRVAEIPAPSRS